jgi:hypothetical protein
MRTARVVIPTKTWDGHIQLDVRGVKLEHKELSKMIGDSVERTQKPFVTGPCPDQLVVTENQFVSLNDYTTEQAADFADRIFITPWGVMEVIVDDDHVDDHETVGLTKRWIDEVNALEEAQSE